jgi:hypothetical protein
MWLVLPFMGVRRSAAIRRVLSAWDPRVYRDAIAFRASIGEGL